MVSSADGLIIYGNATIARRAVEDSQDEIDGFGKMLQLLLVFGGDYLAQKRGKTLYSDSEDLVWLVLLPKRAGKDSLHSTPPAPDLERPRIASLCHPWTLLGRKSRGRAGSALVELLDHFPQPRSSWLAF